MGRLYHLFGVPVWETMVNNDQLDPIQAELQQAFNNLQTINAFSRPKVWIYQDTHQVSDPSFSTNFLDNYNSKTVKEEIRKAVSDYLDTVQYKGSYQYKISSSWLTLTNKNEYAHIHSHGHSDISGAYYFKTNGEDGDIYFEQPLDLIRSSMFLSSIPKRYSFKPAVGKILLFPSWLKHGVKPNPTDNERISLSFNIELAR
jgi:uncharacterized protein (TIGR02466 family)